ncbi:NupC/NupG family nucleoside CNT transporter [Oceanisphaera sp. KMM 10153]|uniref:NupC/NupG family nucleoside CNT transporter n=1 Tax=Oceanisphaera submarina TaxID=3390193 RepID=UPI0039750F96
MTLFMSLVGMVTLVLIAILFSNNRAAIRLRTVGGAFALQAGLGALVLYVPIGKEMLQSLSAGVSQVISYANDGMGFLFGGLVGEAAFTSGLGFIFALRVLPVIIFFSSLIAVLYYLGVMQWVIRLLGGALQRLLGTSRTESLSATANIIDAAATGASSGLRLAMNVGAMLLAFIGLIALFNGMLGGIGSWVGMESLSLELLLGWLFAPLAFLLGVPWEEAIIAGSFIGQKLVLNEFVAYINFAPYLGNELLVEGTGQMMTEHTKAIISFALCGFANLASVAILLGGLGGMAPSRRHDIARFGLRAVLAGTLSNLMSATIAGFFLSLAGM